MAALGWAGRPNRSQDDESGEAPELLHMPLPGNPHWPNGSPAMDAPSITPTR